MTMLVSIYWYSYHTARSQIMQSIRPLPIKDCTIILLFAFIIVFFTAPHVDIGTIIHTSTFIFLPCIWHRSVLGPPPIKDCSFSFYFILFLTHRLSFLFTAAYTDLWTTVHKMISFLACIWHINASVHILTSHVVQSVHRSTHTHALLTSVREPPWFACLCRTDSQASAVIYPMHVLVCFRAFCFVYTTWMNFGPLSTVPTWGTTCATIDWPLRSFI